VSEELFPCPDRKCLYCDDCGLISILGKVPKKGRKCSYFKPKPKENKKKNEGSHEA